MRLFRPALFNYIFALLALLILTSPIRAEEFSGRVDWIYDGDTIKVRKIGKVRLLGIDAPEREDSPKDTYYQRQGVTQKRLRDVAAQATRFNIHHTKKKMVRLKVPERNQRDAYGRLLALVYLPDGRLLNRLLLENGLAAVYRRFDFDLKENFLKAEKEAQSRGKGLWEK